MQSMPRRTMTSEEMAVGYRAAKNATSITKTRVFLSEAGLADGVVGHPVREPAVNLRREMSPLSTLGVAAGVLVFYCRAADGHTPRRSRPHRLTWTPGGLSRFSTRGIARAGNPRVCDGSASGPASGVLGSVRVLVAFACRASLLAGLRRDRRVLEEAASVASRAAPSVTPGGPPTAPSSVLPGSSLLHCAGGNRVFKGFT